MHSRISLFIIIGFALALIALGFYLYQTAPDNDTTNFTDAEIVVVEAETTPESAVESDVEAEAESDAESGTDALSVELVHAAPDGSLVISGHGQAGDVISLYHDGEKLAETTASASGAWTLVPDALLDAGSYLLTLRAREGADGDVAVVVVIPATDEHTPLVALVPLDDSDKQAELLQSPLADGTPSAIRVTESPATQPITAPNASPHVSITAIEALTATRMEVRGDAIGEGAVAVSINGTEAETTRQNNQYTAQGKIPSRTRFPITVTQKDTNGKVIATARIRMSKAQLDASALGQGLVVVQKGDALWRIAFRAYGKGVRYIDIFQSNKDKIRDPDLIYPDQIFIVPKR